MLIEDFYDNDDVLFFYNHEKDKDFAFRSFVYEGLRNGETCIYVYPREDSLKLPHYFEEYSKQFKHFSLFRHRNHKGSRLLRKKDLEGLRDRIYDTATDFGHPDSKGMRILLDFGGVDFEDPERALSWEMDPCSNGKCSVSKMFAFDVTHINEDLTKGLRLGERKMVVSTKSDYLLFLPKRTGKKAPPEKLPFDVVLKESMEQSVKNGLEPIMLTMLQRAPLCGFDIIKRIVLEYNVLLSQGTVYPLLYGMHKEGYLEVAVKEDNKTKLYRLTEEGERYTKERITSYVRSQEKVLGNIAGLNGGIA